jgi:predicted metal-binding membrane protein
VPRDRVAVLVGIVAICVIAWGYVMHVSSSLSPAMGMQMEEPAPVSSVALNLAMWAAMMVGMMLPSAIPMTLLYAAAARKARSGGTPLPRTFVFVTGYLLVWAAFSVAASWAQWGLDRAALLSSDMTSSNSVLGGGILLLAGAYQLTPVKAACLKSCRSPAMLLSHYWRGTGPVAAIGLGARYGLFCLGCCWALMALLFVGGVMNLLWVAALALLVLLEKTAPFGTVLGRVTGVGLLLCGGAALGGLLTLS